MTPTQVARQPAGQPAGSPHQGEPVFLVIGKLRRPHGLAGEIFMELRTDFPERHVPGSQVFLGDEHQPQKIHSRRPHKDGILVKFEGYDSSESAGLLRNLWVFVRADDRPQLPDGEYYHHQLLGLTVVNESGLPLGEVVEILETGAHDVLVIIATSGKKILMPFVDSMVVEVELNQRLLRVRPVPGIFMDDSLS